MITQVFPDEYHLHTLNQFLAATARLNPQVNIKKIVIGMMNRLSAYAASDVSPTADKQSEKVDTARMLESLNISKDKDQTDATDSASSTTNDTPATSEDSDDTKAVTAEATNNDTVSGDDRQNAPHEKANGDARSNPKIPKDIKLFEIFNEQVINLVNMQRLPMPDIAALLQSLVNLAL